MSEASLRCPTCRAVLRPESACPRCGTDLTPWKAVLQEAYRCREAARAALLEGNAAEALAQAARGWQLWHTPRGQALLSLALLASGHLSLARALATTLEAPEN